MRLVQFELATGRRRVGLVQDQYVLDLSAQEPSIERVYDLFQRARRKCKRIAEVVQNLAAGSPPKLDLAELLNARPRGHSPFLRPPLDHADPGRVLVSGTGLTHTGGVQARDQMHLAATTTKTDSTRMFEMGLQGGKPAPGQRGVSPEWFYKGNGTILRGPGDWLEIPSFASDGGEEPELVGCYIIDDLGNPCRLGFALGNEWSDHVTEKINYLYLAPSKLRTCAVGPMLDLACDFQRVRLHCTVSRKGKTIYDSGELWSGEEAMCHSLANCEDHHFKFPQHRRPGDVHLHFFGTSKLSFGKREWCYETDDEIVVSSPDLGAPLINSVQRFKVDAQRPVEVEPA